MYVMYMNVCIFVPKCTFLISCVLIAPEVLSIFRRKQKRCN